MGDERPLVGGTIGGLLGEVSLHICKIHDSKQNVRKVHYCPSENKICLAYPWQQTEFLVSKRNRENHTHTNGI
jgi:hypothetical protein